MSETVFTFDRDFQIAILATARTDPDFLHMLVEIAKPEWFEDEPLRWTFKAMRDHAEKYREQPDVVILKNALLEEVRAKRIKEADLGRYAQALAGLYEPPESKQCVIDQVVQFCRRQAVSAAIIESAHMVKTATPEQWAEIESRVANACRTGEGIGQIGTQYLVDYPERLRRRASMVVGRPIPTGIPELDRLMRGGTLTGELLVWLGGPGLGKSLALSYCGAHAVRLGLPVVHYTFELDEDEICERYDADFCDMPAKELFAHQQSVHQRLDELGHQMGNLLVVKYFPAGAAGVSTLRAHTARLRSMGFHPDLILVDYVDLMHHDVSYSDEYAAIGSTTRALRAWIKEEKAAGQTASQVNRAGFNAEIVDLDNMGDSFQKAQIADKVIALCANREERQQGVMRLHLAKNRKGPKNEIVKIENDYERSRFYVDRNRGGDWT